MSRQNSLKVDPDAEQLVKAGRGKPDDLLCAKQVCAWLKVSESWLEKCRRRGDGPPTIFLSDRELRFLRKDVLAWLKSRKYLRISDYRDAAK